jgi:hypothetical protein
MFSDITFHENAFSYSELLRTFRRNDEKKDRQIDKLKLTGAILKSFVANALRVE